MLVVKIGGSIVDRCAGLVGELAGRRDVVVVHGFGPQSTALGRASGSVHRFLTSPAGVRSRFTDAAAIDVMIEAATGVARELAAAFERETAPVELIRGDEGLLTAAVKPVLRDVTRDGRALLVRGNRSGIVDTVDPTRVRASLAAGRVPIVTPLASDREGIASVDGDRAAAALAGALNADALVLFTDVTAYLARFPDAASRVARLSAAEIDPLIGAGAKDGMVRKLVACREALHHGVSRALIASGLGPAPLANALAGDCTEVVG